MAQQPHDQASQTTAEQGEVMVDGPDGTALSLTPRAARETARALDRAADEASRQTRPDGGSA